MRFFQTSNASRQYNFGGVAFAFEPVDQIGGIWLGVLAVEDDSIASIILAGIPSNPQVSEITEEEYNDVKKKPQTPPSSYKQSGPPLATLDTQPLVAAVVGQGVELSQPTLEIPVQEVPQPVITNAVILETKAVDIPDELMQTPGEKTLG